MVNKKREHDTADDQGPPPAKNLLEWMSARGAPDSIKVVVVGLLLAITVTPYFGGRTVWSFGSTPILVPTISDLLFWPSVVLAPFVWTAIFVPLFLARASRVAMALCIPFGISILLVVVLQHNPWVALDSMTPNSLVRTHQTGFQVVRHPWIASHLNGQYCYFHTPALDLGTEFPEGCTFRVDRISIESGGRADVSNSLDELAGFDVEVFVSSSSLLNETRECVEDFGKTQERPKNAKSWVIR
jgi:hypothetical protein